jgi:hypothetical protein
MRRRFLAKSWRPGTAAALVALGLFVASGTAGAASPLQTITGSFTEQQPSLAIRQAGSNIIVDFTAPVVFTGGIAGTATSTGTEIVGATGDFTVHAVVTCACTVDGRPGTVQLVFNGTGSLVTQQKQGQFQVSGSSGLDDLHGTGTFTQSGLTGDDVAQIHFAP